MHRQIFMSPWGASTPNLAPPRKQIGQKLCCPGDAPAPLAMPIMGTAFLPNNGECRGR